MKNISALPILCWVFLHAGCATIEGFKEQAALQTIGVANKTFKFEVNVKNEAQKIADKPPTTAEEQPLIKNDPPTIHNHPVKENRLVQIGRYSAIHPIPTEDQQDILKVIIKVTLPEEIDTTGQAIRYLLKRSGYQLALPQAQGPEVLQLLAKKMPEIHRKLGPMTLENALLTLTAPTFRLQKDPVHRLIAFELTPDYATEVEL